MAPSNRVRVDVRRLRNESVAQEYKRDLPESLGEPDDSDDPEKFWIEFMTKFLEVSESCLRDTRGMFKSFLTKEPMNIIEESRRSRLEGKTGQYREVKREAVRAVRRNKEAQLRGVYETVDIHVWSTDSRPAYRGIRTMRSSKPSLRCSQ